MSHDSNCIFCKIVRGEIPAAKAYENDHVLAFLDISQVTKGHILVIPKTHRQDIFEMEPDIAAQLFRTVPTIAKAVKKQPVVEGVNLLNNNGKTAGQTVFHYHMHIIPRYGQEDGFHPHFVDHAADYTPADLQQIASSIRAGLQS